MAVKPLPQTPILAQAVDKTTRNAFTDVHSRVNQLIKWLGTVSQTVLPHKDTHKTGGSDPLTPADIGAATTTHASTHKTGGSDALTPADIGAAPFVMGVPPGAVMAFAMSTPPDGWLECNGQAVSRTTYAALFAAIGITFGEGDGATTFNLPDLRGEFIRGWDHGRGVDGGRAFGSWQSQQITAHKHVVPWGDVYISSFGRTNTASKQGSGSTDSDNYWYYTNDGTDFDGTVNPPGIIGSETRPRNIALLWCIKY